MYLADWKFRAVFDDDQPGLDLITRHLLMFLFCVLSIFVAHFLVGQITDRPLIMGIDQIYLYLMSAA